MKLPFRFVVMLFCAALAACGSTDMKESLGLNRKAPDEFQVVSRPPLSVPPEFNLRPPGQGAEYSSGLPAEDQAHNKILGASTSVAAPVSSLGTLTAVTPVSATELPTSADSQFLSNAGADKANPAIKQIIHDENQNPIAPKDNTYLFGDKKGGDTVVDSSKEAQRLKDDKAQDKPPTTGDTPVVAPQSKGILGEIF